MTVTVNRTTLAAKDREASARFFRELFELANAGCTSTTPPTSSR